MTLVRVTPPTVDPVTTAEARAHLRVDEIEEDGLIDRNIKTATQRLDGASGILGRCLIAQTWDYSIPCFPYEIEIPLPPCQSISSISYLDDNGDAQALAMEDYQAFGLNGLPPAFIRPAFGQSWPTTRRQPEAVTVRFVAGFGSTGADVPDDLRQAILAHVAQMYDNREGFVDAASLRLSGPLTYDEMIAPFRAWIA